MRCALRPVHTVTRQARGAARRGEIKAEGGEPRLAHLRHLPPTRRGAQEALAHKRGMQRHAEASGEMVPAGPRIAQVLAMPPGRARARSRNHQPLEGRGGGLIGDREEAVAALRMHRDEPTIDELREMRRSRGRGDAGGTRKLAGGERLAAHQRLRHRRPRRVSQQGGEAGKRCGR